MLIPILGPAYESKTKIGQDRKLINWYLEENPYDSEHAYLALPTPGHYQMLTSGITGKPAPRGLFRHKKLLFTVYGKNTIIYDYTNTTTVAAGTNESVAPAFNKPETALTDTTTVVTSGGRLSFADINNQTMFTDGERGYLYDDLDTGSGLQYITTFPGNPSYITSLNEYFIVTQEGTGKFFISTLTDGSTWNALDFATAETSSDNLVAAKGFRSFLWLFGEYTTEIWYNSGNLDFPFERQPGGTIPYGCAAKHTITEIADTLMWVGNHKSGSPVVFTLNGFEAQIVSTRHINQELSSYSRVDDAYAYAYTDDGHEFYVLTFPSQDKTWVYDITTQMWHERRSTNNFSGDELEYYAANCYSLDPLGRHIIGSRFSDSLFIMSSDYYYETNEFNLSSPNVIRRILRSGVIEQDNRQGSIANFQVRVDPGLFDATTTQPEINLRISKDYGYTWCISSSRTLGTAGQYRHRVIWTRLGLGRNFIFQIEASDPVNWVLLDARADVELDETY